MTTQEEVNQFLLELRDSGVTNMFGSGVYVEREFNVSKKEASEFVLKWMSSMEDDG